MTPPTEHPRYTRLPKSGALLDEAAYAALMEQWRLRAPARIRIRRLSTRPGPDQLPVVPR